MLTTIRTFVCLAKIASSTIGWKCFNVKCDMHLCFAFHIRLWFSWCPKYCGRPHQCRPSYTYPPKIFETGFLPHAIEIWSLSKFRNDTLIAAWSFLETRLMFYIWNQDSQFDLRYPYILPRQLKMTPLNPHLDRTKFWDENGPRLNDSGGRRIRFIEALRVERPGGIDIP